jgi:hypothetical protein
MGVLEKQVSKGKRGDVQKAMIAALGIAGVLAVAMLAPNTLQLLRYVPRHRARFFGNTMTAARRLVLRGYAVWVEKEGKKYLRLTDKGKKVFAFEQAKISLQQQRKRKWDGKWRMVVFDVPERRRGIRFKLRSVMRDIGFARLQDSVWVYPYNCEDFIALLKADLKIGKDVLYAIVDTIENDKALRNHFGLLG